MVESWSAAIAPVTVATLALIAPGLAVVLAGWGTRRLALYFFAPAISLSILAIAAVIAGTVGLTWGPLPVALTTVVVAAAAFATRRLTDQARATTPPVRVTVSAAVAMSLASVAIGIQLITVFGNPTHISQTFDAIVHLNTVRYAIDTANASAFHIGATSDIGFYPNAWHALASLVGLVSGTSVPIAVTAANMAIGAVAWPASTIALSLVLFGDRIAVVVASAALSTGFGAFPILLFDFGVLYPNATAYAILPAGLAAVWLFLQNTDRRELPRTIALILLLIVGIGLAHPNAVLALYAMSSAVALAMLLTRAIQRSTRRVWITNSVIAVLILGMGAFLWRFSRTGWAMSRWGAWESTAQALGEAALISPRGYPVTVVTAAVLIVGLIALARRPRQGLFALPFAVAVFMFVLVAGTPVEFLLREMVTNPWYNDPFRLAALLPIPGIPVAVFGFLTLTDAVTPSLRRYPVLFFAGAGAASLALFSVAGGANVRGAITQAQIGYREDATSALLTSDEAALIARLDEETPADALIAGSPWTGTSLAYALAGRDVVEMHVFGSRSPAETYLDENFRNIDTDPNVCAAVREVGATYVLDFGTQNVFNRDDAAADHAGIQGLPPATHLELVDQQGSARLLKIVGC